MNEFSPTPGLPDVPIPRWDGATVLVDPPGPGFGNWAGAPSAVLVDGTTWLVYRMRSQAGGRSAHANVVARSEDGRNFETVTVMHREEFGAHGLERATPVPMPDGSWRLYVSCCDQGPRHWWVDLLEADDPSGFDPATRRTVLPVDELAAVKDPVIVVTDGVWRLWASCHPIDDRMTTDYYTSPDGVEWTPQGTVLAGRPGHWDARGVRFTAVVTDGPVTVAYYDGRATAEENFDERTGLAVAGPDGTFRAVGDAPVASSPHAGGGLRYLSVAPLPEGGHRLYYEATLPDGSHELRVEEIGSNGVAPATA